MEMPQGRREFDVAIEAANGPNRGDYRASIVWDLKVIAGERSSPAPDQKGRVQGESFAEAWIWRGGWINLIRRPTLILSYRPQEPARTHKALLRKLTRKVIAECDLAELAAGDVGGKLLGLCAPHRIWPVFGYRQKGFAFKPVPDVLLLDWPDDQPFPDS